MDYYIKVLQDEEFMSHDWESLMFLLSIVLSYIYISTIFYKILLCQSGQGTCPVVTATSPEDSRSIPKTPLKQCCPE